MQTERWPSLALDDWEETYRTLHRYTQIVGKVRLGLCSPVNHWWHTSLRFTATGLTTTLMPIRDGEQLEILFDFVAHELRFITTAGQQRRLTLESRSVAQFYAEVLAVLQDLRVSPRLWPVPVEVPDPVPFPDDAGPSSYDKEAVGKMWRILSSTYEIFQRFRGRFRGKSSPVHLFWGAFDVAVTRFSGRENPSPPQDAVMREAYSHEVISHGFWFGGDWPTGGRFDNPLFYAYAVPQPQGLADAKIQPDIAHWSDTMGEFILPYEKVRRLPDPDAAIESFLQSAYEAAAERGGWPRDALDAP